MARIEGYPEDSWHGQYLTWGRTNRYAPYFTFDRPSEDSLRGVQAHLAAAHPDATMSDDLHATILYCPPRTLFEAVQHIRGWQDPSVEQEAMFYADVSNGLETGFMFNVGSLEMPVEELSTFEPERGLVVVRLAQTALISEWRRRVVELLQRNLREYYGLSAAQFDELATVPSFQWLFKVSHPHVTVGFGIHASDSELAAVRLPGSLTIGGINPRSPRDFLGRNSLLFDHDAAFDTEETPA